jgi:hypothetical protein
MPLTDFEVVERQEHVDDCVVIAANDGKQRVVASLGAQRLKTTPEDTLVALV